jgi:hypothetical protein
MPSKAAQRRVHIIHSAPHSALSLQCSHRAEECTAPRSTRPVVTQRTAHAASPFKHRDTHPPQQRTPPQRQNDATQTHVGGCRGGVRREFRPSASGAGLGGRRWWLHCCVAASKQTPTRTRQEDPKARIGRIQSREKLKALALERRLAPGLLEMSRCPARHQRERTARTATPQPPSTARRTKNPAFMNKRLCTRAAIFIGRGLPEPVCKDSSLPRVARSLFAWLHHRKVSQFRREPGPLNRLQEAIRSVVPVRTTPYDTDPALAHNMRIERMSEGPLPPKAGHAGLKPANASA